MLFLWLHQSKPFLPLTSCIPSPSLVSRGCLPGFCDIKLATRLGEALAGTVVRFQNSPPERPRSCSGPGLWGSGWCARSCGSPGWWNSAPPRPETPARSPAPWRRPPAVAAASGPAPPARTWGEKLGKTTKNTPDDWKIIFEVRDMNDIFLNDVNLWIQIWCIYFLWEILQSHYWC